MSNQESFDLYFIPVSTYIFPDSINKGYQAPIDTWSVQPDQFFKSRSSGGSYLVQRNNTSYQLKFPGDLLAALRSEQDVTLTGVNQCVSQQLPAMTRSRFSVTLQRTAILTPVRQFVKMLRDLTICELSYDGKMLIDFTTPFNFETDWSCKTTLREWATTEVVKPLLAASASS